MLRRGLIAVLVAGIAGAMLAGCRIPEPADPQPRPTSPEPTPAFTGNLRPLIVPMPDNVNEIVPPGIAGEFGARQAASLIDPSDLDAVQDELDDLGFVAGSYKEWRTSGTTTSILLLQFLDEDGAAGFVDYATDPWGRGGQELAGIPGGVWSVDGTAARAVFHRDGIAIDMWTDGPTEANADEFLSLVSQQYDRLPAG